MMHRALTLIRPARAARGAAPTRGDLSRGRAGCPQPAVVPGEKRISREMRSAVRERTAEDSRPYPG